MMVRTKAAILVVLTGYATEQGAWVGGISNVLCTEGLESPPGHRMYLVGSFLITLNSSRQTVC